MIHAIALCGPTASGKTALSVRVAKRLGCEIISCDSMQLYRGMDIGTAKVTAEETLGVPHHMIDILDPREDFSVSDYREAALRVAEEITARGKLPFFVGGTGLYIDSLTRAPLSRVPESDPALLEEYRRIAEREGGREALHARLDAIDPESAVAIHPNNVRRVIRALILYDMTGETKSELDRKSRCAPPDISVGMATLLFHRRETLYERVDRRVDEMLAAGLEDEVRALLSSGALTEGSTAAQAIGYKELLSYLHGSCTREEAADAVRLATRRYAKRQLTWFRAEKEAMPVYTDLEDGTPKSTEALVSELVACYESYIANNC